MSEPVDSYRAMPNISLPLFSPNAPLSTTKGTSTPLSHSSRSGLSSPAIEPALSPLNISSHKITFNSTTSVITEAANRLRQQNTTADTGAGGNAGGRGGGGGSGTSDKVVMFSAQRRNIIDVSVSAQVDAVSPMSNGGRSGAASPPGLELEGGGSVNFEDTVEHFLPNPNNSAAKAAERLKKLIRRAESGGSRNSAPVPFEVAFKHFDQSCTGVITPSDLQAGFRRLGTSFEFSLEEYRTLLQTLSKKSNKDPEEGISLLGWYRALGRNSPPPMRDQEAGWRGGMDLVNSPVVRSEDAANRLRDLVLRAELENGTPLESSFQLFDHSGTGLVTAADFRIALRSLQEGSFAELDEDCCEELAALFDVNQDGQVSLLDFYRFMGRNSPPLKPSEREEDEDEEASDLELDDGDDGRVDERASGDAKANNSRTERLR